MQYTHWIDMAFKLLALCLAACVPMGFRAVMALISPKAGKWAAERTLHFWGLLIAVGMMFYIILVQGPFVDVLSTRLYVRQHFGVWATWDQARVLRSLFCVHVGDLKWYPSEEVKDLPLDQRLGALMAKARVIGKKYNLDNGFKAVAVSTPVAVAPAPAAPISPAPRPVPEELPAAREENNPGDQYRLGMSYEFGRNGKPIDYVQAASWYERAAEQGNAGSMFRLALFYSQGEGVPRDYAKAAYWYGRQAEHEGCTSANQISFQGKSDVTPADIPVLEQAAGGGDAEAQNQLGYCYSKGLTVPKDYLQAARWYEQAARQGLAKAEVNLASAFTIGQGLPKDLAQAAEWYRKAAEAGDPLAEENLGFMYQLGQGVARDEAQAVFWYEKAAQQGNLAAENNLAAAYQAGKGVPKNLAHALELYQDAAQSGNAYAQYNMGRLYEEGWGVPEDDARAAAWYQEAAGQGVGVAAYHLGACYENGRGVPQDAAQALVWYRTAASKGIPGAAMKVKASEAPVAAVSSASPVGNGGISGAN